MAPRIAFVTFVLSLLLSGLAVRPAHAATSTSTVSFGASATVQAACVASTSSVSETYARMVVDAKSIVSVTCTNATPYTVRLSSSVVTGGTVYGLTSAGKDVRPGAGDLTIIATVTY